jgi:hypothetical protein
MKKISLLLLLSGILFSCSDSNLKYVSQEVVYGKVSATESGHIGRFSTLPIIWVQTAKQTKEVTIPFEYDGKWKVGDSCLLIIQKYKEVK